MHEEVTLFMHQWIIPSLGGLIATCTALIAAFTGGGSAFLLFPFLLLFLKGSYISLFAVAKISATLMTFVASQIHWKKRQQLDFRLFLVLSICGLIGTIIGTYVIRYEFNEQIFRMIMASVLLSTALFLAFSKKIGLGLETPKKLTEKLLIITAVFTIFTNILNGIFGGTGILLTLYLVSILRIPFIQSIAYTMLCYFVINIFQTSYLLSIADIDIKLGLAVAIGGIIGSWTGTHLQYWKGNIWVKKGATLGIFLISLKLISESIF
ncbi:sulfite exporter TauE/SafE family protein [Candidatus Peregrinibacteria bacterium]|nr:sulfite exporter TauE/SafE family protein [Candidatus Peregrinibacteria bacterium]